MNYLTLLVRLTSILNSSKLKGDKAAYLACRTVARQLEDRNPGLYADLNYEHPIPD